MSRILIDLSNLGKENKAAVQGIKLFLNKNKKTEVVILGNVSDLLTIKDNKNVKIYRPNDFQEIDKRFDVIKDKSLRIAMYLLNDAKEQFNGFVTYSKKSDVANAAKEFLYHQETSPLFIATFANYKTHRVTCIGDIGYNDNPTIKDYRNYLDLMKRYMNKAFKKEKPEFKLLTFSKDSHNPLVEVFKSEEGYKGEVEGRDLFKCDTDIVIGNPHEFLGIISGIDHGISIYDEYIKDYMKHNVGIRLFSYPMFRSVLSSFHMEIDQKLTSGGNILLGYTKNIVVVDPGTIKLGMKVSLNLADKLETI